MATPGKPRQSAIPAPGKSGIPTPGRSRSVSSVLQSAHSSDAEDVSRALVDALKANDPVQHRLSQTESQTSPPHSVQSGRRSVAERRAKTPATFKPISRPPSRHSDAHIKTVNRQFDVGDSVRIDSLALEGVLRYMGEIEGKNGVWAGVELSGQFAGKGKNNGSVNGIRYFSCSENCGVFVATSKLSPGRFYQLNVARPPSVASSRSGRASFSGRITPSVSTSRMPSLSLSSGHATPSLNGRITPSMSSGRVTPGITPSAKPSYPSKTTPAQKGNAKKLPDKITPGSRAAKYANMTAKQLSSRKENTSSPIRQIEHATTFPSSPSPISRTLSSPSRPPGSPFSTPKPSLNGRISNIGPSLPSTRGRSAHNTPRGRVPSAVAMPPPASPASSMSRSASLSKSGLEELALSNLELQGKTLQDRISLLMGETSDNASDRPDSAGSVQLINIADDRISDLQARLATLEAENARLLSEKEKAEMAKQIRLTQKVEEERKKAEDMAKLVKDQEDLSKTHETTLAQLEDLHGIHQVSLRQIEELEKRLARQLEESQRAADVLNGELADVISLRQKLEQENQVLQTSKEDLKVQVDELGIQVDELRLAGQETIALYEERLSVADGQRYDLETRIANLERVPTHEETIPSHQENHRPAAEIDNEALRDQVIYLQKKITTMEDLMEESRIAGEKDEAALRERMKKLKEKEENMKLEVTEGRREAERMTKAEASARNRVEEIEEALRESQVALENARAEIETLRADVANIDALQRDLSRQEQPDPEQRQSNLQSENSKLLCQNNELLARIAELTNTTGLDKKRMNGDNLKIASGSPSKLDLSTPREEITGLKHIVQELQKEHSVATQKIKLLESENEILKSETKLLQSEAEHLRQEVQILENNLDVSAAGESPEADVLATPGDDETTRRSLKEQKTRYEVELENLRKHLTETETKQARTTHDLNKEISELEALVESKIYREDELEQEVERLREKLSKVKKSTKSGGDTSSLRHQPSSTSMKSSPGGTQAMNESVCEICERPGHDIFTCDLLKEDAPKSLISSRSSGEFCDDCEGWGHTSVDCPHSQDVF